MRSHEISHWQFALGDEPEAWAKSFDDAQWQTVRTPHDWSVTQPFSPELSSGTGYLPGGIGWYRAHVSLAGLGSLAASHVRLVFDGVYKNAQIWVNGYHMGGRPSGYAAFSFDLDEILSYANSDDLVVSVRVEHTDISDSRWYNGSGITRRVRLEVHPQVRIAEYGSRFTTVRADEASAEIRWDLTIRNGTAQDLPVTLHHELRSLTSNRAHVFATKAHVAAGSSADVSTTTQLADPELWSDEHPDLYRLTTTLNWQVDDQTRRAAYADVVGIRTFRFDADTGFSINGVSRKLKGVCLHEDAGCFGTAVPTEVWLRRLLKLRHMGCNGIRMAHNPHSPELYRLCDALGFFVIDEAFDEWENPKNKWWQGHNVYPPRHQGYAKDFHAWHERDLVNMVEAHRNHPSIIAWSIGNEIDYPNDPYASAMFEAMTGNNDANKSARQRAYDPDRPDARRLATIARRLAEIVRRTDTTRPVTVGSAFPELSRHTGLLEPLDLVGYNYKEHLYPDDHGKYPSQPLVGSENGHGYSDWRAAADNNYIAGQFLWTGIDYLGETHGWPQHGSRAGLLTVAGLEKPAYHLRRSWWVETPVARIATRPRDREALHLWSHPLSRDWPGIADGTMEVVCIANGTPRLTCGATEVPLTFDEEGGFWVAAPLPEPALLLLEVQGKGQEVARDMLGPSGEAVRLDAETWQIPEAARRACVDAGLAIDDLLQIECTLFDADGQPAGEERMVTAEVTGGELLGIENGDLADNTPYTSASRSTCDGRLVVFVRRAPGVRLRLSSPGLPEVVVGCD